MTEVNMVTGAGGMVGSHMVEAISRGGGLVFGTYYRPTIDLHEIDEDVELLECDVRYPQHVEAVVCDRMPTKIFHLAAQSYPTVSWTRPYETLETNVLGTASVFEAVKAARRLSPSYDPMVVVACSSAEYGQTLDDLEDPHVREDAPLLPLHPYGVSKVGQDLLSYQYWRNDGIRCIRARIFNSTGTRKRGDVTSDFTRRAVEAELSGVYELRVGNLATRRAIMDVRDLVRALLALADRGRPGEVYNVCSKRTYAISEIVHMVEAEIGHDFDIRVDERLLRPTDERVIVGDVTRLVEETGWEQRIELRETVADMVAWWRNRLGARYQ